ncbi:glycosyl transferase, partial [Enterococcus faecium]
MFCKVCDRKEGFCGFRIDIKELAKVSDIFLFTTLQEGMPRSMMEAMASGLPCIASKIRGNVDLLVEGKGGYLVPAKDAELVAECLRELINNKSLRKYMG